MNRSAGSLDFDGARLRINIETGAELVGVCEAEGEMDDSIFTDGTGEAKAVPLEFASLEIVDGVEKFLRG